METDTGRAEFYQLATLLFPRSAVAESYRTLRSNIEFGAVDSPVRTLLVTSAAPDDGKTITAPTWPSRSPRPAAPPSWWTADLRKPGVHLVFQATIESGLTTLLRDDGMSVDQGRPGHGAAEPADRHHRTAAAEPRPSCSAPIAWVRSWTSSWPQPDLVIFDAPPVRAVADVAGHSPTSMPPSWSWNAESNPARRPAPRAGDALARAGATLLGVVAQPRPEVGRLELLAANGYFDSKPADPPPRRRPRSRRRAHPKPRPLVRPTGSPARPVDRPTRRAAPKQT